MIKRQKIFYSKSEIQNSLYTQGNEFMTLDKEEYVGAYHKYLNTGEIFSGNSYNERTSQKLIPLIRGIKNKSILDYLKSSDEMMELDKTIVYLESGVYKPNDYVAPISYYPKVTQEDYNRGYIERYFTKKRNDTGHNIIEINESTYSGINTNGPIDGNLYAKYKLKWKISGKLNDVVKNGITVEHGIYDTNMRVLNKAEIEFKGIKKYLTDKIEFGKVK